jgi:hypothetical protein
MPCSRRQQARAQAKVVSMFGDIGWQKSLADLIWGTLLWFSLYVIAVAVRFFVREARFLFSFP